jgi:hypothetical protein
MCVEQVSCTLKSLLRLLTHYVFYSPDETREQKGRGKLKKDGTAREAVVRY